MISPDKEMYYPEVAALIDAAKACLKSWRRTEDQPYLSLGFTRLEIDTGTVFFVPVDNEYFDLSKATPAVIVHLVLSMVKDANEVADLNEWAAWWGVPKDDPQTEAMYEEALTAFRHLPAEWLDVEPLSEWDEQMNTAVVQALRANDPYYRQ